MAAIVRQADGPVIVNGHTVQGYGKEATILAAGDTPPQTSVFGLGPSAVIIRQGEPDLGPTIMFSPESIKITLGPPNVGSSILLDADGITLAVGPTTTLKLTGGGVTIEAPQVVVKGSAGVTVQGLQVVVKGTAAGVNIVGSLIKMGPP